MIATYKDLLKRFWAWFTHDEFAERMRAASAELTAEEAAAQRERLRDEFAMAAISGVLAHAGHLGIAGVADVGKAAYKVADSMLAERDK